MTWLDSIAQTIATVERANPAHHNPGNITVAKGGAISIATFPDDTTGWAKLYDYIQRHFAEYPSITLYQFFAGVRDDSGRILSYPGYAPAGDGSNDPAAYAAIVATRLTSDTGIPTTPNTTLAEIAAGTGPGENTSAIASPDAPAAASVSPIGDPEVLNLMPFLLLGTAYVLLVN